MKTEQICSKCGAELEGIHEDACPACLLEIAVPESLQEVGPFKVLQKLGEGGCGIVFMAEQEKPIRRRVAVKLIKLGMDTKQVIARFDAERQALALMDHFSIAKVLDAGATAQGRPYFVMELVRGIKITEYCDKNHLSTEERLRLFIQVCSAIQHAHQKGIIHRDIKPSNILVTLHDGVPVPKVIDFGIAKATTDQRLTDLTFYTAFEQFIGTPAYMSPEQAEMSGLDIDTRSDIYSLGVLLYELLTGRTPFDQKKLMSAGLDEMRRLIREEEPIRPSTRVSSLASEERTTTASHRDSAPLALVSKLRGDLDWIVMRCLEKDRTRRYETVNGLAMDVRRHLESQPVTAGPPSQVYRMRKLIQRNRTVVAASLAVAAALLLGLGLWLAEREARNHALLAEQRSQAKEMEARESERRMRDMLAFFRSTQITRTMIPRENRARFTSITNEIPSVVPPGDPRLNGRTYEQLAAAWWKWALEMPMTNAVGAIHTWKDTPRFDIRTSQSSNLWFIGSPFLETTNSPPTVRYCEIPYGVELFAVILSAESSSIEEPPFYGATESAQAVIAQYWTDHAVEMFFELDGVRLSNLEVFRVLSPQIEINAPRPWILGEGGGRGTSTGDGYYVLLAPLSPRKHTLRMGGKFKFARPQDTIDLPPETIDVTYHITVAEPPPK
ncbi:MAG TPA: serine/threonine-protein kinase [Verrucomicrobiae bacterium]